MPKLTHDCRNRSLEPNNLSPCHLNCHAAYTLWTRISFIYRSTKVVVYVCKRLQYLLVHPKAISRLKICRFWYIMGCHSGGEQGHLVLLRTSPTSFFSEVLFFSGLTAGPTYRPLVWHSNPDAPHPLFSCLMTVKAGHVIDLKGSSQVFIKSADNQRMLIVIKTFQKFWWISQLCLPTSGKILLENGRMSGRR